MIHQLDPLQVSVKCSHLLLIPVKYIPLLWWQCLMKLTRHHQLRCLIVQYHLKLRSFCVTVNFSKVNKAYHATGKYVNDASVKSAIVQDLTKVIFSYTAYPSHIPIRTVVEALV